MGVAGEEQDKRRYVRVRGRELGPSLWGEREEEEAESADCSASSSRRRASSLVIFAWRSWVRLVRFFS